MRIGNYEFTPRPIPTLATLVLLPILISLGIWQLDRAGQKREMLQQYEQQQAGPVLILNNKVEPEDLSPYQWVEVSGKFDTQHQFLLDNKVYQGRAGYQVITPLRMTGSDQAVLINRGWVPQMRTRKDLPAIPTPAERLTLAGQLKLDVGENLKLGKSGLEHEDWPRVIQWLEIEDVEKSLGYKVQDFVILQTPDNPAGFVRDWHIKKIVPEKSISYAVQWLALALALVIIYLVVNLHKVEEVSS